MPQGGPQQQGDFRPFLEEIQHLGPAGYMVQGEFQMEFITDPHRRHNIDGFMAVDLQGFFAPDHRHHGFQFHVEFVVGVFRIGFGLEQEVPQGGSDPHPGGLIPFLGVFPQGTFHGEIGVQDHVVDDVTQGFDAGVLPPDHVQGPGPLAQVVIPAFRASSKFTFWGLMASMARISGDRMLFFSLWSA